MSRRHRLAVVALIVLSLPVWGSVCTMMCDPAPAGVTTHHGSGEGCERPAETRSGLQVEDTAELGDCTRHAAVGQTAIARERPDITGKPPAAAAGWVRGPLISQQAVRAAGDHRAPPGSGPPISTPVVLRV